MHLIRFDVAAPQKKMEMNNIHRFNELTLPYILSSASFSAGTLQKSMLKRAPISLIPYLEVNGFAIRCHGCFLESLSQRRMCVACAANIFAAGAILDC